MAVGIILSGAGLVFSAHIILIIGVILVVISAVKMQKQEKESAKSNKSIQIQRETKIAEQKNTLVNSNTYSDDFVYFDKGEDIISHLPVPIPGQGYALFPTYKVCGKKSSTNRKNTRHISARTPEEAIKFVKLEGIDTDVVAEKEFLEEFSGQLDFGLVAPKGCTNDEAFIFSNCCSAKDTKHTPTWIMDFAFDMGIPLSYVYGREYAAKTLYKYLSDSDKAMFYGFVVACNLKIENIGNPLKSQNYSKYEAFAKDSLEINIGLFYFLNSV